MNPQDYKAIRYQRWAEAEAHDEEMIEKCFAAGKDANDIENWCHPPKPYSSYYFRHFLGRIVKQNFIEIVPFLRDQFIGDEVDKDYINALLTDAEVLGLEMDDDVVIVNASGEARYPSLKPFATHDFRYCDSSTVFYGGQDFRARARMVRNWCQERISQERIPVEGHVADFPSEDVALQELFTLGFTVQYCDDLLKKIQIGSGYNQPGSNYFKASLWALLDLLKEFYLLNCELKIAAPIIGNHYKCPMPHKPSKARESSNYKISYGKLQAAVKNDIRAKKYG